jgi:hypothetical protein
MERRKQNPLDPAIDRAGNATDWSPSKSTAILAYSLNRKTPDR